MGVNPDSQRPPNLLDIIIKTLPRSKSATMKLQLLKLGCRTRKSGIGLVLPVALSVLMIKCDAAGGTPAVRKSGIWIVSRHNQAD